MLDAHPVLSDERRLAALRASGLLALEGDERLDRLTRIAAKASGCSGAFFAVLDDRFEILKAMTGLNIAAGAPIPVDRTLCRNVVEAGTSLFISDLARSELPAAGIVGRGAYAGTPFADRDGHVLGVCCLMHDSPREWDASAQETLADFARSIRDLLDASSRDGQPWKGALDDEVRLARLAADVGYALTSVEGLPARLQSCTELIVHYLDAHFVRIWTLDESGHVLQLVASAGRYTHLDGDHARVPVGEMKIGQIAAERRPHLTNSVVGDPRVPNQEWARREGLVSFAGYPLITNDELVGVVALFSRNRMEPAALTALEAVATGVALAIERGRTEEALRASETRLESVVRSALDAVITIDHRGTILTFNPAAEATFGFRRDDVIGREMADVIVPVRHRDAHRAGMQRFLATREPRVIGQRIEITALRADGSEFPVELAIAQMPDTDPPHYAGFLRDITDRQRADEERDRLLLAERKARAESDAQRERSSFLGEASRMLATSLSLEQVAADAAGLAVPYLADACALALFEPDGDVRRLATVDGKRHLAADEAVRNWSERLRSGTKARFLEGPQPAGAPGRIVFGAPLRNRDRALGALLLVHDPASTGRAAPDLSMVAEFALRAAVAIDNALAHERLERQAEEMEAQAAELEAQTEEQAELEERLRRTNETLTAASSVAEERRQAAEQAAALVERSERELRFRLETIPVHVWTARPDGALDFVTNQCAAYFGKTAEQVLGEGWLSVLHPDDVDAAVARWVESLETGRFYETEFRLYSAEAADYRWFLARAVAFRDEAGAIVKWLGSNTDIHEKKQLEDVLERSREAEHAANVAKTRFLNMLSHELRTPLGAIGGYVELLLMETRGTLNDAQKAQLERVSHNQQHLLRLINDLLELAKAEAKQLPIRPRMLTAEEIFPPTVAIVQSLIDARRQGLETDVDPAIEVFADPDRLRQILINLLGNAIKFTPEGGRVGLSARREDGRVRIAVEDSGPGVPPEDRERIFEAFAQSGSMATVEGTGLGLAISREYARLMGGDVCAADRSGGAEFLLTLPVAPPD